MFGTGSLYLVLAFLKRALTRQSSNSEILSPSVGIKDAHASPLFLSARAMSDCVTVWGTSNPTPESLVWKGLNSVSDAVFRPLIQKAACEP